MFEGLMDKEKAHGIGKVRYSHDAMIDLIIARPTVKQNELAEVFGYTPGWVSRVIGSDAFQARLSARKAEIVNPELVATFEDRLKGLAAQSLEVIQNKLEATGNPDLAIKALQLSTTALGYGARQTNVAQQVNNYVVALPPKVRDEKEWAVGAVEQVREAKRELTGPLIEDVTPKEKA